MNTIIYKTHFELMNTLTDAQAGLLIKAIGTKMLDGREVPNCVPISD